MNVVFDTNIFVAALVFPGGQAEKALQRAIEGRDHLYLSRPIVLETLEVLARKFSRDGEALSRVAVFLADAGTLVEPQRRVRTLRDEPDNRILECALACSADAIVTGDKAFLALGEFRGIAILSLRAYLAC